MSRLSRFWHLCLASYIVASVVYTTRILVVNTIYAPLQGMLGVASNPPLWIAKETWDLGQAASSREKEGPPVFAPDIVGIANEIALLPLWKGHNVSVVSEPGPGQRISMEEDLVFSKAFATSMQPSKIIPYFYKASGPFDQDEVTITTIITSDRLAAFARLVERYQGPISVTFHVKNTTHGVPKALESLRRIYASSQVMGRFVDIHLVVDSFDRQFNTWRNLARLFARTEFIMMLDVDFYLCTDFRISLRKNPSVKRQLQTAMSAFVIPAFEYTNFQEGKDYQKFPSTKAELVSLAKAGRINMFHSSWKPGHNSTDYPRFYAAAAGETYKVTDYQSAYEPYIIFKKTGPPWCEERFVGYGGNKAACLFEMYLSGMAYYVLADHFIIHQNHLYEETARRTERKYNRKIYSGFKEEICFRYLRSYHDTGLLNTTRAKNAITECKKLKPIRIAAPQLLGD